MCMYNRYLYLDMFKLKLPNILPIEFLILPKVTSILPFFFLAIKPCFILDFILFFFHFHFFFTIRQYISAFYIYLNTYFCTSIWKKMFKTKCLSSHHLLGSIGSLFLTWIITVASESLIFVPNPLISIFKISPR